MLCASVLQGKLRLQPDGMGHDALEAHNGQQENESRKKTSSFSSYSFHWFAFQFAVFSTFVLPLLSVVFTMFTPLPRAFCRVPLME